MTPSIPTNSQTRKTKTPKGVDVDLTVSYDHVKSWLVQAFEPRTRLKTVGKIPFSFDSMKENYIPSEDDIYKAEQNALINMDGLLKDRGYL